VKLIVTMDWPMCSGKVGELEVFSSRGAQTYQFTYAKEWTEKGFQIDPALPLVPGLKQHSQKLPGAFEDISPDRWGRMVQQRARAGYMSDADFMVGVSDFMRMGALRLAHADSPDTYIATDTKVPKLIHLRELEAACLRMEKGQETESDLRRLLGPGSSLGGANPKAGVWDGGKLYLAKFQSNTDTERVAAMEATMLDLAGKAGIPVATHRLLDKDGERPVLLVERFDRNDAGRVPFASAMTLAGLREGQEFCYAELASVISAYSSQPKLDRYDLWRRMTFNAMTGNTDDHMRNHGFLRSRQGWRLSPAYDLNLNNEPLERRAHALAFEPGENRPSLALCKELAEYFGLDEKQIEHGLNMLGKALHEWRKTAQQNGLTANEINRIAAAFEHRDSEKLVARHCHAGSKALRTNCSRR
jgi:serine/threonine-protein kinase HipA